MSMKVLRDIYTVAALGSILGLATFPKDGKDSSDPAQHEAYVKEIRKREFEGALIGLGVGAPFIIEGLIRRRKKSAEPSPSNE